MFRVTPRLLVTPNDFYRAVRRRPHNFRHPYIYPLSEEEREKIQMPYRKQRYGFPREERPKEEHVSRMLSSILRHNAVKEGIPMRDDGFVKVKDILSLPRFHSYDFVTIEHVVMHDAKKRYNLLYEPGTDADGAWWIRANQGHSIPHVNIEMIEVTEPSQVRMAVHGTNKAAWSRIAVEGLSRMNRQHVHFAQGVPGSGVLSGMRTTSEVLIYLDVPLTLESGLKLLISANEVVCCPGDEKGYIAPRFFRRVEWAGSRTPIKGWGGSRYDTPSTLLRQDSDGIREEEYAQRKLILTNHSPSPSPDGPN